MFGGTLSGPESTRVPRGEDYEPCVVSSYSSSLLVGRLGSTAGFPSAVLDFSRDSSLLAAR